jgi:hypothetical protein
MTASPTTRFLVTLLAGVGRSSSPSERSRSAASWNVRLADGTEVHLAGQLEDLGLALSREAWPAVGRVKVTAVPKEGWRRFFEYVVLERETGFEPATSTLARLRSTE